MNNELLLLIKKTYRCVDRANKNKTTRNTRIQNE